MNFRWSLKQIVMTALACTLIGIGGLLLLYRQGVIDRSTVTLNVQKELDASSVQSFSLQTDTAHITVVPTTGNQMIIKLSGKVRTSVAEYADIELDQNGGDVRAVARTTKRINIGIDVTQIFQLVTSKLEVTVELPEKVYRSLSFTTDTGRISLPALKADTLEVTTDTADILLKGFTGTNLKARSDTGTLRLDHLSAKLSLRTDTGHIIAGLDNFSAPADVETDTGDIRLTMEKLFPAVVDFSTDTGRTIIQLPSPEDFTAKKMEKRRLEGQLSGGGPLLQASTDTGDVELVVK
ncbi:MAG: hypothetical protein K0Q90_1811 [Paenibacillaceae bacterium]|jgi:DUF4097 and DUF4098 domain-containing protein YvlB|nr:hypothetical protein [Paenibacillaceae bacterium]